MMRLSFRQSLIVPYVVLVLGVAALIGWLSYRVGGQTVDTLADHLLHETVGRISQAVDHHLIGSKAVLEAAFPPGVVAPEAIETDFEALRTRFWTATSLYLDPNNYVYYGSRHGQFFGLWRHSLEEGELRVKTDPAAPRSFYRFTGVHGTLSTPIVESRVFDPRERPWYKVGETHSGYAWTPIYIDFRTGELVATPARRVLDARGNLAGVVASDISLRGLNEFVRTLKISEHSLAFIMEIDGYLIASSRTANIKKLADGSSKRLSVRESEDALQIAAFERVRRDLSGSMSTPLQTLHFDADGEFVELAYSRLSDMTGLDWIIVVAMPRSDFMQGVTGNVRRTAIIGAVAALLAVAIGLSILSWVSRDLNKLAIAARDVGQGRLDSPLPNHRKDEIGDLANSFRQMQQRLRTDSLTELVNREGILRSINDRIHQHRRRTDNRPFAVFFMDLNNFKLVNDRLGHDAGDRVLIEISQRLRGSIRSGDLVARYAGDEFVLLANDIPDAVVAEKMRSFLEQLLREPAVSIENTKLLAGNVLGGSVGVARYPSDAETADELIKRADADMYARKETSKLNL
ncbi:MAG: diguanylate cyclase [Candidatus Competibacter denitrificans]